MVVIGAFMILVGIGMYYNLISVFWPYIGAFFIILIGVWFLIHGLTGYRERDKGEN
jgi:putative Mn2+ efflux pump MntP